MQNHNSAPCKRLAHSHVETWQKILRSNRTSPELVYLRDRHTLHPTDGRYAAGRCEAVCLFVNDVATAEVRCPPRPPPPRELRDGPGDDASDARCGAPLPRRITAANVRAVASIARAGKTSRSHAPNALRTIAGRLQFSSGARDTNGGCGRGRQVLGRLAKSGVKLVLLRNAGE